MVFFDPQQGIIDRRIFSDEDLYRQELDRVFGKSWLFLAHEGLLPNVGDYITTYMGEDPVIVVRGVGGRVRAFLNSCPHRGNKVCLHDRGNARTFTCSYHGWSFNTDGELKGIPFHQEAYLGELEAEAWGLVEVGRVESFGGLLFGCWDPTAPTLESYLGDLCWYLEAFYLALPLGGLEFPPGRQRYMSPGNWKIPSDNFSGDHYHTPYTHGSAFALQARATSSREAPGTSPTGPFEVATGAPYGKGLVPHGLGGLRTDDMFYRRDLQIAETLGAEVVDWVKYRQAKIAKGAGRAAGGGFIRAHILPNFSINGATSAFTARGLYLWHPRGPHKTLAVEWCAVERDAPEIVKRRAVADFARGQSAAGFFGQDDTENFERVTENTRTPLATRLPFNYTMGLRHETSWPGSDAWETEGLPGLIGPRFSEINQRRFYAHWAKLMEA